MRAFLFEFLLFGLKQARACIFAGSFFALLLLSRHVPLFGLPRYDFLCLAAVALQVVLVATRIESKHEVMVLSAFHLIGLGLELFKTQPAIHSWSYPEAGYLKIGNVPIYSGFMYAAVASYMCQAWRLLDLELSHYPPYTLSLPLAVGIYANFFTHHYVHDLRWPLTAAVFVLFFRTRVHFIVWYQRRTMPLVFSFALIGFFIWVAENLSTLLGAYVYPNQHTAWRVVSPEILSSWFLLVIVSFILVADLKHVRETARRVAIHAGLPQRGADGMALRRGPLLQQERQ